MGLLEAPVKKSVFEEKVGVDAPTVVVFIRTDTVLEVKFATAMSGLPSPLKSPILTAAGFVPTVKFVAAANVGVAAPIVVVFKNTDTFALPQFATTISSLPSPLISATKRLVGDVPAVKSVLAEKVGVADPGLVVFIKTDTVVPP
jgi:hypothetical protein